MTGLRNNPRSVVPPLADSKRSWPLFYFIFCAIVSILIGAYFRSAGYDRMQTDSDAAYFFDITSSFFMLHVDPGNENIGPIYLWATLYRVLNQIGIKPDPLWGILINAAMVVAALHIFFRYACRLYALTATETKWLALLLGSNGVLMMSAGLHLRDSFLILLTTLTVVLYGRPLNQWPIHFPASRLLAVAVLAYLSYLCRVEGFIVPILVAMVATYAFGMRQLDAKFRLVGLVFGGGALLFAYTQIPDLRETYFTYVERNFESYRGLTENESDASSISVYLLYQLPPYLSVVFSSIQMLFIKVPAWREIGRGSYDLYMSLAAIQMLVVAPLAMSTMLASIYRKYSNGVSFHVLATLVLLLVVSLTSIQVRHFAVVYPSLMLLAVLWRRETKGKNEVFSVVFAISLGLLVGLLNVYIGLASVF